MVTIAGVVLLVGLWSIWGVHAAPVRVLDPMERSAPVQAGEASAEGTGAEVDGGPGERSLVSEPESGRVEVTAEYKDGAIANGVGIVLQEFGMDLNVGVLRTVTDDQGECRFDAVPVGDYVVSTSCGTLEPSEGGRTEVTAGRTNRLKLVIPAPYRFHGRVIDAGGRPVDHADVWMSEPMRVGTRAEIVARTDAAGRFEFRTIVVAAIVWARAENHAPSSPRFVSGELQGQEPLEIVLPDIGGNLRGRIVDGHGKAVRGGVIRVGQGRLDDVVAMEGSRALPSEAISDDHGEFRVTGLPVGSQQVVVRAAQFAPWQGECTVVPATDARLDVVLQPGASATGRVVLPDGAAVPSALVECGDPGSLLHYQCLSDGGGQYELSGLAAGETRLAARTRSKGRGEATVMLAAGARASADIVISMGLVIRGVLKTDNDAAVADAEIEAQEAAGSRETIWFQRVKTSKTGEFTLTNVPAKAIYICASHKSIFNVTRRGVDGGVGFVTLIAAGRPEASAFVVGRLVESGAGSRRPARVNLVCDDVGSALVQVLSENDAGKFEFGPLAPGAYTLRVRLPGLAEVIKHASVGADSRWDFGDVVLSTGGYIRIAPDGVWPEECYFGLWDRNYDWVTSIRGQSAGGISGALQAGQYYVSTLGDGIAREPMKGVTVAEGETTSLVMAVRKGTTIKFVVPDMRPGDAFTLRVRQGEDVVWVRPIFTDDFGFAHTITLRPGSYQVECARAGRVHRVPLQVSDAVAEQECQLSYAEIGR